MEKPNTLSVLYRNSIILHAVPKYISKITSYIRVRLAFHCDPHLIQDYCNNHWFGPPLYKIQLQPGHGQITRFRVQFYYTLYALLKLVFTKVLTSITKLLVDPLYKRYCHLRQALNKQIQSSFNLNTGFSIFTHVTISLSVQLCIQSQKMAFLSSNQN